MKHLSKYYHNCIPDKIEICIAMKNFNLTEQEFDQIPFLTAKKIGEEQRIKRTLKGIPYTIVLKPTATGLLVLVFCSMNGNRLYRHYYGLPEKAYPFLNERFSNFITEEETENKLSRTEFSLKLLTGIIYENTLYIFNEVKDYLRSNGISVVAPIFSFQVVEFCCDIPVKKDYDPTNDYLILNNLTAITEDILSRDYLTDTDYVVAPSFSFERGLRVLNYHLFESSLDGRMYTKDEYGVISDLLRIELIITSRHKRTGTDQFRKFTKYKYFNTAQDITAIFEKIITKLVSTTDQILKKSTPRLSHSGVKKKLNNILEDFFEDEERAIIVRQMTKYEEHMFQIHCSRVPRSLLEKIIFLTNNNFMFRCPQKQSGYYLFDTNLLFWKYRNE